MSNGRNALNPFSLIWNCFSRKSDPQSHETGFVDLAPTSNADESGIYRRALTFATNNEEVFNIALTGPYGSGKSSVIKSFLLTYPRRHLTLSLASFIPEGEVPGVKVSKQEIERSILQQILYGADSDKLPLSRFKRIQAPSKWSSISSLAACLGIVATLHVVTSQADILSGKFFKPFDWSNWFNISTLIVASAFFWRAVHSIYLKSLGLSLKSISLKDIEIAPNAADEGSILNKHLDEIIYFFQSTDYDLVVIEDLDRFDTPDIFVTLREINALVNENADVHRRIRFLYALRDDIFINTDRTKFFEFIVPVIPIINHSNSIDKVLEHSQRIDLDARLDRRFIRDVSRYLADLRLIGNIFNEYTIYASNLRVEGDGALDPNKLLAVLIYKNVIPKDFAALHRQEGALSNVLKRYDEFVESAAEKIRSELGAIQAELARSDDHSIRDITELHGIYALAIIELVPLQYTHFETPGGQIALLQLSRHPDFEAIFSSGSIKARNVNGYSKDIDLRGVDATVDPTRTFAQRKALIEQKSSDYREATAKRSQELKARLALLRTRKFNEVVRENAALIDQVFADVGESRDLLKFLILEGYLDDTYYQYTSLFHGGRLSLNDNKFLIQIRSFTTPDPDFQLDNIPEVIASMREEDFGRTYVLNRFLIDFLMENAQKYSSQANSAIEFILTDVLGCEDFFSSYYERGAHVDQLTPRLIRKSPAFPVLALKGALAISHAARILAYAPNGALTKGTPGRVAMARFVAQDLSRILDEGISFDLDILSALEVQIEDISSLLGFERVLGHVASEGLYRITVGNVAQIMKHVVRYPKIEYLKSRNFSCLREAAYAPLLKRIDSAFETYVGNVLLKLESNTEEDVAAIVEVLNRDDVALELRSEFLTIQTAVLSSLDGVPAEFHSALFQEKKIVNSWENCLAYLSGKGYDPEVLMAYLQDDDVRAELSQNSVPDVDAAYPLRQYLIANDVLPDNVYRSYVRKLPRPFKALQKVGTTKIEILIRERKVEFSAENVGEIEDESLKALFIELNFGAYLAKRTEIPIDIAIRERLLNSGISDQQKMIVIADIEPGLVVSSPSLASAVGPILDRSTIEATGYAPDFVRAIILNSRPEELQISLLNKLHSVLSATEVREILQILPSPYRDIAEYGRYPKIDSSPVNEVLATWLLERRLISSFAPAIFGGIRINTFRKNHSSEG